MEKQTVAIIGAGKVGSALAIALERAGYAVVAAVSRTQRSAKALADRLPSAVATDLAGAAAAASVLLLATPDREIGAAAQAFADSGACRRGQVALHVCGSQSASSLQALRPAGVSIGAMHPLQTFSEIDAAVRSLPGTYFAIDGDERAVRTAREMVSALGGKSFCVPQERRALYHAAACVASNYTVALLHASVRMLAAVGMAEREALDALAPLLRATLDNAQAFGTLQALTGPIVRGDAGTVEKHLRSIDELSPEESTVYRELGIYAQRMAQERGVYTPERQAELLTTLHRVIHNCE